MRVGIIGATGMLGHHTARAVLERGHELIVIHRESSNLKNLGQLPFSGLIGDLNNFQSLSKALSQVDVVINCAGYYPTGPRHWRLEVETATNQMKNFYQACQENDLKKIVYLGAAIALKKNKNGVPATETSEYEKRPKNKNPYLQVKWAMDVQAKTYAKQGLPIVIGIPSMTFGEYDFGPTTGQLLMEVANESIPAYIKGKRNCIYAGDAGRGLVLACEKGRPGERYLFTGTNITMDELIPKIAEIAGVSIPKSVPLIAAKSLGKFQELKFKLLGGNLPKISSTALAVISSGQFLDGSKAELELGFKPSIDLTEAIKRTLVWFSSVGYLKKPINDEEVS